MSRKDMAIFQRLRFDSGIGGIGGLGRICGVGLGHGGKTGVCCVRNRGSGSGSDRCCIGHGRHGEEWRTAWMNSNLGRGSPMAGTDMGG